MSKFNPLQIFSAFTYTPFKPACIKAIFLSLLSFCFLFFSTLVVKMDKSFKCDFCDTRVGAKRSLWRHYKQIHGEIPDSYKLVKENITCEDCGQEVANRSDHKKYCKGKSTPNKAKPSKLAASASTSRGIQSPSTAMASLQIGNMGEAAALQDDAAGDDDLVSEEAFYQRFINFVVEREGGSANTAGQYKRRLESFALFIRKENPEFQWGQTLKFRHLGTVEEYTSIPTCFKWVNTHVSCSNQHGAVNAYLKLVDFLNFELYELQHVLSHNFRIILKDKFLGLRGDASSLLGKLQKKIIPERRQKLAEQANLEEETEISMEEMKRCCDFYRNCPWRLSMYEKLKDMEAAKKKMTPVEIRNFCALEVLFEAGGQRPEVIKNITIGDLINATDSTATGIEKKVIHISQHKTSKTYGLANIIIPKKTFNLLLQFQAHFMETEVDNYYDSYLFMASGSGKQLDRLDQCCTLFAKVTKTDSKIIPKSFRYLVAHLGQTFDDEQVREKLPGHMNHSRATANLHYIRESNKADEHNVLLTKAYGESSNLPDFPEFEGLKEDREFVNAAKRAKLEEDKQNRISNFVATGRKAFNPKEKTLIVKTFASVQQSNLRQSDYDTALEESEEFRQLVESHKDQGKDASQVFKQVQNSFRATRRK